MRQNFHPMHGLLVVLCFNLLISGTRGAEHLILWDTTNPSSDAASQTARTQWKQVPLDLFSLEADPAKASSDPGYYGKEYSFKGQAVVESPSYIAVFQNDHGQVVLYEKGPLTAEGRLVEIVPVRPRNKSHGAASCQLIRHTTDEIILSFGNATGEEQGSLFAFDRSPTIEIRPARDTEGFRLLAPIQYGIIPDFIGDDLIFGPSQFSDTERVSLPAENSFLGLLAGERRELLLTWPPGEQRLSGIIAKDNQKQSGLKALELETQGRSFYVTPLAAAGIWHEETLSPTLLEKDFTLAWKPPFPAKWQTELEEAGVRTTFAFRSTKGQIWRGVPGSYIYPAWIQEDQAHFHLTKKVPPKGKALIYFLEGQNTPLDQPTPAEVIKATLGRSTAENILDPSGRKLRTHHRRGDAGVHRACTCGCTEAIQAVFEAGQETLKKDHIDEALDDMIFFVQCHLERIDEYRRFADELIPFLQKARQTNPQLGDYLESLEAIAQQIPQEYENQRENMKSLDHAHELAQQTLALTGRKDTDNLKKYMELLKAWRAMGGAQDYVVAQYHATVRKLSQQAGYGSLDKPQALALAKEIRNRCRQCLRNPDGYEIWSDY